MSWLKALGKVLVLLSCLWEVYKIPMSHQAHKQNSETTEPNQSSQESCCSCFQISCPLLWVAYRSSSVLHCVTYQVVPRHRASKARPCLCFPTPVGPWHRFVNGVWGLRNQLSPKLLKQGFSGGHMGCPGHEEGGSKAEGGGPRGGSRSGKVVFFSPTNKSAHSSSFLLLLAGRTEK